MKWFQSGRMIRKWRQKSGNRVVLKVALGKALGSVKSNQNTCLLSVTPNRSYKSIPSRATALWYLLLQYNAHSKSTNLEDRHEGNWESTSHQHVSGFYCCNFLCLGTHFWHSCVVWYHTCPISITHTALSKANLRSLSSLLGLLPYVHFCHILLLQLPNDNDTAQRCVHCWRHLVTYQEIMHVCTLTQCVIM